MPCSHCTAPPSLRCTPQSLPAPLLYRFLSSIGWSAVFAFSASTTPSESTRAPVLLAVWKPARVVALCVSRCCPFHSPSFTRDISIALPPWHYHCNALSPPHQIPGCVQAAPFLVCRHQWHRGFPVHFVCQDEVRALCFCLCGPLVRLCMCIRAPTCPEQWHSGIMLQ